MANSVGLKTLMKERDSIIAEKKAANDQWDKQIAEMESCIELLSGKKVWEVEQEEKFDDENPNYIKGSIED